MALAAILHRRLFIGAASLSLLAMAGAATTLATTNTQAQSPNDALCAQQDAEPDEAEAGPDTDNIELECGDQNEQDDGLESGETAEQGEREASDSQATRTASGQ